MVVLASGRPVDPVDFVKAYFFCHMCFGPKNPKKPPVVDDRCETASKPQRFARYHPLWNVDLFIFRVSDHQRDEPAAKSQQLPGTGVRWVKVQREFNGGNRFHMISLGHNRFQ